MTQSLYALVLLDEEIRMDSFASTSLVMVVEEAKEAIRTYLDENGEFRDTPEMALDGGFATIHKFQVATRATGEIIWTYSFDGEELLEDALLPLLTHEDYILETNKMSELSAVNVVEEESE
jgi:hypothetical protein